MSKVKTKLVRFGTQLPAPISELLESEANKYATPKQDIVANALRHWFGSLSADQRSHIYSRTEFTKTQSKPKTP